MLSTQNCNNNNNNMLETRATTKNTTIEDTIKKLQEEHESNSKIIIKKLTNNKEKFEIKSVSQVITDFNSQQQQQQQQTSEPITYIEDKTNNDKMSTKKTTNRQRKCKKRKNLIVKLPMKTPEPKKKIIKQTIDSPESLVFDEKNPVTNTETLENSTYLNLELSPLSPVSTATMTTDDTERETYQNKSTINETMTSPFKLQLSNSEDERINETKIQNNNENVELTTANEDATHNPTTETCVNVENITNHENDDPIVTTEKPKSLAVKRKCNREKLQRSITEIRRSKRVKRVSSENNHLAPIYQRDVVVGVDGKKTFVRSIVGFKRINNDLAQFRERFFKRLIEIEKKSKEKKVLKSKNPKTTDQTTTPTATTATQTNDSYEICLNNKSINHNQERIKVKDVDTQSYKKKDIIKFKENVENKEYMQIDDGIWVSKITSCKGILRLNEEAHLRQEHDQNIKYYIQSNYVLLTLNQQEPVLLSVGDYIEIPKCNQYEIENHSKSNKSHLLFEFDKI